MLRTLLTSLLVDTLNSLKTYATISHAAQFSTLPELSSLLMKWRTAFLTCKGRDYTEEFLSSLVPERRETATEQIQPSDLIKYELVYDSPYTFDFNSLYYKHGHNTDRRRTCLLSSIVCYQDLSESSTCSPITLKKV